MERLWSPVVATGGNRSQIVSTRKRLKQAKTVATGCDRLPRAAHGKEEVAAAAGCVVLADTRLDYTPTTQALPGGNRLGCTNSVTSPDRLICRGDRVCAPTAGPCSFRCPYKRKSCGVGRHPA